MFTKQHTPEGALNREGTSLPEQERADWGQINREILANKLRKVYFERTPIYPEDGPATSVDEQWLNVANEAISEILGDTK